MYTGYILVKTVNFIKMLSTLMWRNVKCQACEWWKTIQMSMIIPHMQVCIFILIIYCVCLFLIFRYFSTCINFSSKMGIFSSEKIHKYRTINGTELDFGIVNYNRMHTICLLIIIVYSHSCCNHINRVSFCGTYAKQCRLWCLIRVFTVWLQNVLQKLQEKWKVPQNNRKNGNWWIGPTGKGF